MQTAWLQASGHHLIRDVAPAVHAAQAALVSRQTSSRSASCSTSTGRCTASRGAHTAARAKGFGKSAEESRPWPNTGQTATELNAQETAALDELINMLADAPGQEQFGKLVADNVLAFDQKFWVRLAARSDMAPAQDKDRFQALANSIMIVVEALVQKTDERTQETGTLLQEILANAADDEGHWDLPLEPALRQRMFQAVADNMHQMDESMLANAMGYMKQASDDRIDGIVDLLQTVLQMYAGLALQVKLNDPTEDAMNIILTTPEAGWSVQILKKTQEGVHGTALLECVQRRMESIALQLPAGSLEQRVQAEFLNELQARIMSTCQISPDQLTEGSRRP